MITYGENIKIFCGNSNPEFAKNICKDLGVDLGKAEVKTFADGEASVSLLETVRGADVFLVQSTCKPVNDHLMELLVMCDACRRASAGRITAVIPYFGYARQDRKAKSRDPISAKLVANMLTASGADRVLTMDLHANQIQGFFDVPVDALYASGIFVPYIKSLNIEDLSIAAPDMGGAKRANTYAKHLSAPIIISHKERAKANVVGKMTAIGDVKGRNVIIVDDMISSGDSMLEVAQLLKDRGANKIFMCSTFGLFTNGLSKFDEAYEKGTFDRILTTNLIYQTPELLQREWYINCDMSKYIAYIIDTLNHDSSISDLLNPNERIQNIVAKYKKGEL